MERKFLLLDDETRGYKFGVHIEETEVGTLVIVNLHFPFKSGFEILLTDSTNNSESAKITENPFTFILKKDFVVDENLVVDVFLFDQLIVSNVSEINIKKKTDEELKQEADYYIKKARKLYSSEKKTEMNKISSDFNIMFGAGEADFLLSKKFKNSEWRKVDVGEESYILGKIYASKSTIGEEDPMFFALAIPTTYEESKRNKKLGDHARFYHANIYDSFGFLVLIENAKTGKPVYM